SAQESWSASATQSGRRPATFPGRSKSRHEPFNSIIAITPCGYVKLLGKAVYPGDSDDIHLVAMETELHADFSRLVSKKHFCWHPIFSSRRLTLLLRGTFIRLKTARS